MHIGEAISRVRDALKRRTGRAWTAKRFREGRSVTGIQVTVNPRYGNPDDMAPGDKKELAGLLDLKVKQIGAGGVVFGNDQLEDVVDRAEFGLSLR